MLKTYKPIIVALLITAIFYCACIILSAKIIEGQNQRQYKKFLAGKASYTPLVNGVPEEIDTVYNKVFHLASEKNIIFLGASTTRQGVLGERLRVPDGWKVSNLAMSGDTVDSLRLMHNYMNKVSNHPVDKTDVVVVHIWYATFTEKSFHYLKSVLELFGLYKVDNKLEIKGNMSHLRKNWRLLNYRIVLAVSRIFNGQIVGFGPNCMTAGAILGSIKVVLGLQAAQDVARPPTDSRLKEFKVYWAKIMGNTRIPGETTDAFKNFLNDLKKQTNVIVVNLYIPTWHRSYPAEQQYEMWLNKELIPFLSGNDIPFIDFSWSIPDSEYGDSAHLFIKGRERYTDLFNAKVMDIISVDEKSQKTESLQRASNRK